jgi:hypothetical protein
MPVDQTDQGSLEDLGWILLGLALAAFCIQSWWILASTPKPGWFSDSIDYLILADFFRTSFTADSSPGSLSFILFGTSRFPPLLPVTLAFAGGGAHNWAIGYSVCLAAGLLSIVTTFFWLRQQTARTFTAAALLPLAVLSPQYFLLHLGIYSESQFLLLMTLILWLVTRYEQGKSSLILLAFVAGVIPLSRTAGVSLLLALTVWLVFRDERSSLSKRLLAVALMWCPAVAWQLYRKHLPIRTGYVEDLSRVVATDSTTWISMLHLEKFNGLLAGFAAWFDLTGSRGTQILTLVMLILCAFGWYLRCRRWRVDAMFLPIYLGLVFVWPYPAETARLLAVSMPVVAICAWESLACMVRFRNTTNSPVPGSAPAFALLGLSALASGPTWMDIVQRASLHVDQELEPARRSIAYFVTKPQKTAPVVAEILTRFEELVKEVPNVVSNTDCVWTPFMAATAYYSNFGIRPRQLPEGIMDSKSAKEKLAGCRYIVVVSMVSPQISFSPLYPLEQVDPFSKPVLISYFNDDGRRRIAAALLDLQE